MDICTAHEAKTKSPPNTQYVKKATIVYYSRFGVRNRPVIGLCNRGPLKILNGIRLILDDQGNHLDLYTIRLESFRSFKGPLFRKPITGQELFLLFLAANRL